MAREASSVIAGLGMSVLDLVQVIEAFPEAGGVSRVVDSVMMGGGPVPTALCAAAKYGVPTVILDRLGEDWKGALLRADYERYGVETRYLISEPGRTNTLGTVLVRQSDGERHLIYEEGDTTPLSNTGLSAEVLDSCDLLHLNGRHWPACLDAARRVRERGGLVSFDGGAHRYDPKFAELFPWVDVLIVAADFADRAVGIGSKEAQLERLAEWGASFTGITDGIRGSWILVKGEGTFHQPAFEVPRVVDTTGCGDVYHGIFLAALAESESPRVAAKLASAGSALAATALGGRGFLPTKAEIAAFLESAREVTGAV